MLDYIKTEDLERLFSLSPEMFTIFGYDGFFKSINSAWERTLGFSRDEILNCPCLNFIHPDEVEDTRREVERIAGGDKVYSFVNRYRCKDGSYKSLLWSAASYPEEQVVYAVARDITERINTEDTLRESQRRLSTLMSNLPGMAYRLKIDSDWVMEYVSEGCFELTGYQPDELIKHYNVNFGFLTYPDDRYTVFEAVEKTLQSGSPYQVTYRMFNVLGEIKWVWEQGRGILNAEGKLEAIEGFITDITEYKKAESEQQRLTRALKAITQINQITIRATDENSLLNEVCQTICNIQGNRMVWVGYMENDQDKTIKPIAWKGHENGYLKILKLSWGNNINGQGPTGMAIRTRKPATMNVERDMPNPMLKKAALDRGYISVHCAPLLDEKGEPFGVLAIYADSTGLIENAEEKRLMEQLANDLSFGITSLRARLARQAAEDALMESEGRYRILVESSPVGIGIQQNCKWIYVNSAAVKIFNASSSEEVIGKLNTDFGNLPDSEKERIKNRISQIEKGVDVGPTEFHADFEDGSEKYVHVNSVNITYKGEPAVLTLLRDITAQKIAEKELRFSREELRNLAAHLQVAREEERTFIAREIHDELGQYLTGLKMDISFLEDIINEKLSEEEQQLLMERVNSISSLLDTTVKSVRKIASELRPVILDSMGLLAAIEWLSEDFKTRTGIPCECFITVQDITLPRDKATAVFRILQESLTNVMRHAQAQRVTVSFIEDEGSYLMEIKDDGKGIMEEDLKKSRSFGLLGMKERAMLFGGTVDIQSAPGKGTTISVTIPALPKG